MPGWILLFEILNLDFDTTTSGITTTSGTTTSGTTIPPTPGTEFCASLNDGLYPHPTDCSRYYQCNFGDSNVLECPSGTVFDPKLKTCNWDWAVNTDHCDPTATTTSTTTLSTTSFEGSGSTSTTTTEVATTTDPTKFCVGKPNGLYANPDTCRKFYQCHQDKVVN